MVSPASRRGPRGGPGNRGGGGPGNRGGGGEAGGERRGGRGGRGRDRDREQRPREDDSGGMNERVVHTRRIAKVVKGGRRLRFNALVVVGDGQGRVGAGMGKALAIPDAVRKGTAVARRSTVQIPIKGSTIPHEISVRKGASIVILKPAPLGTGIIAAGAMRAMLELGGVQDVVGKSLGSRNPINIVQATMAALNLLRDPEAARAARLGLDTPAANGAAAAAPEAAVAEPPPTEAAAPATAPEPTVEPAPAVAVAEAAVAEPAVAEPAVAEADTIADEATTPASDATEPAAEAVSTEPVVTEPVVTEPVVTEAADVPEDAGNPEPEAADADETT